MSEPRVIASVVAHSVELEGDDALEVERTYVLRLDFPAGGLGAGFSAVVDTAIQTAEATGMLHDAVRRVVVECEYTDGADALAGEGRNDG